MLVELSPGWIVVLNVGGWLVIQLGLAWAFVRMPAGWFKARPPMRWERGGAFYERYAGVRRWKGLLPDGAQWFAGGFAKAKLRSADREYLKRFALETRRGEMCHWVAILAAPVFFLWNPWWGDLVIVAYALGAKLGCIVTQRYNRARIFRALGGGVRASGRRPGRTVRDTGA